MFLSLEQIAASLTRLQDVHPFFGMSFLAFKRNGLPVGEPTDVNFSAVIEDILQEYYRPDPNYQGFYNPFKTSDPGRRWTSLRYGSTSVQRFTVDTFGRAFIHKKGTSIWGWRTNYLSELKKQLHDTKIPAFDLAVWIFRKKRWSKASRAEVRDHMLSEFSISGKESKSLFDVVS